MDEDSRNRHDLLHLFADVFVFIVVFVCLVGNFTLPLKYKVQVSGKTEINGGLSLPAILKEIPPSSHIFAGIYGTHSHATTFQYLKMGVKRWIYLQPQ